MQGYNPGQIRKYLKQLRQREQEYIYYLGRLAYQAGEEGRLEEGPMLDAYRTLKDIREQAVRWEAYLEGLRAAKMAPPAARCPRCGNYLTPGAATCPYCGQATATGYPAPAGAPGPVPPSGTVHRSTVTAAAPPGTVTATVREEMRTPTPPAEEPPARTAGEAAERCPGCGKVLEPDANFCGSCGRRVRPKPEVAGAGEETPAEPTPATEVGETTVEKPEGKGAPPGATAAAPFGETESRPMDKEEATVTEPTGSLPCSACGKLVGDPEARFCPDCGARLRE
ncbi:zinc ribbon domain-containing protein [Candidatus Solincola sp.]|nr:zinc ribbon domain-containing protein [Actinomycetota bacterium]